jgi:hypothetical protein
MRVILASFMALAAACASNSDSSDGGPGPGQTPEERDYSHVATAIGANAASGELFAMVDTISLSYGVTPDGFNVIQPGHINGTRGGFTFDYIWYCHLGNEMVLVPCDGTEGHQHTHVMFSGTAEATSVSMDGVKRVGHWIVRDIAVNKPRIDGTGTNTLASHFDGSTYTLNVTDKATRVRFEAPPSVPTMGMIDVMLNIHRASDADGDRDFAVVANVAFAGPDTGTLTLDGTKIYSITFSTGEVTPM